MATTSQADEMTGIVTSAELDNGQASPRDKTTMEQAIQSLGSDAPRKGLESMNMRADPDAQATVTDYLDFTEYLPADMTRSLTLIGKLDQTYIDASISVDRLTQIWGKLPTLTSDQRRDPVQLRADISENLNLAVSSRVSSYSEACRMAEHVNRHVNRAKAILSKLQTMHDNYKAEEQKSPVLAKSPQLSRAPKPSVKLDKDGQKVRRPPRITVPGEVLAPYEVDFNVYSSFSEGSSDEDESVRTSTPIARIKLKVPKMPKDRAPKPPRQVRQMTSPGGHAIPMLSTSTALAKLKPPPENAVLGSADAPWLQLTQWELAKLRKRMKKNAVWSPSDTMIARELKVKGRGVEAYNTAKKQAHEEGRPFEPAVAAPITDAATGVQHPPEGAISAETLGSGAVPLSNKGMKLNEAKKLKREQLAKQAVEEAEESARQMAQRARMMFPSHEASPSVAGGLPVATGPVLQPQVSSSGGTSAKIKKRKRDSVSEAGQPEIKPEFVDGLAPAQPARPQVKRTKTDTPIPPPHLTPRPTSVPPAVETPVPPPQRGHGGHMSTTPVPVPVPPAADSSSKDAAPKQPASPPSPTAVEATPGTTTQVPTKPPAETPAPQTAKTSTTPIPLPDVGKRETRNVQQKNLQLQPVAAPTTRSSSRPNTPIVGTSTEAGRRPASRGQAASVEPPPSLASERPRRASTARNTPAPEARQPSKRTKRPAPGVVNTDSGTKSAVGKRKAAPRKRTRPKKGASNEPAELDEVDDNGDPIDPDEPRYCVCNGVSFGEMILCENADVSWSEDNERKKRRPAEAEAVSAAAAASRARRGPSGRQSLPRNSKKTLTYKPVQCRNEWFHLECVGLVPKQVRRNEKWYCPDCKVALGIGEPGEATTTTATTTTSSRGAKR